ncbi:MAG TPA: NAD(P)H-hydrate dehydratase [Flavisolibacter sp.]|nr:NAD(P)H-hydrate dehydratase [Flavisolibacter sp.]
MQILSAEQIRAWDKFTIEKEPIASVDLMERAATACVTWLFTQNWDNRPFAVFCGKGNNGGDGLAIARMLLAKGFAVAVYILESDKKGSDDFEENLQRLQKLKAVLPVFMEEPSQMPVLEKNTVIIDALFGTGLTRPLDGLAKSVVDKINAGDATVVSIDIPSGLFTAETSIGSPVIRADYTLTFQCYKTALLIQENAPYIGQVEVLDISLHPSFLHGIEPLAQLSDEEMIRQLFKPRNRFAHKGTFGHALLAGGSYGKIGAMVLATRACLQSGAGLTSAVIPACGYVVLQTTAPEAMAIVDDNKTHLSELPEEIERFNAIGIGPGMGTSPESIKVLSYLIRRYRKPLVVDADGLNCLALDKDLLEQLPPNTMLTPHPKEFDRLFGSHFNDFERMEKAIAKAQQLNVIIILKSHHSLIATPTGKSYFNATGNAGMAKGGSGDVLTGILTSLLAQGYEPVNAAILGVYLHGWAGDVAARKFSQEAMLPSHLINCLPQVFLALQETS